MVVCFVVWQCTAAKWTFEATPELCTTNRGSESRLIARWIMSVKHRGGTVTPARRRVSGVTGTIRFASLIFFPTKIILKSRTRRALSIEALQWTLIDRKSWRRSLNYRPPKCHSLFFNSFWKKKIYLHLAKDDILFLKMRNVLIYDMICLIYFFFSMKMKISKSVIFTIGSFRMTTNVNRKFDIARWIVNHRNFCEKII